MDSVWSSENILWFQSGWNAIGSGYGLQVKRVFDTMQMVVLGLSQLGIVHNMSSRLINFQTLPTAAVEIVLCYLVSYSMSLVTTLFEPKIRCVSWSLYCPGTNLGYWFSMCCSVGFITLHCLNLIVWLLDEHLGRKDDCSLCVNSLLKVD